MKVLLISEVVEDESALLIYLGEMQIMPGAKVTVLGTKQDKEHLDVSLVPRPSPQAASAEDKAEPAARTVSLTRELASKIWVKQAA
jgi:hypothetical protein